jgi:class 3 adenylate cyclase
MGRMTCQSCGARGRPGARFCEECGWRLEATCPACGASTTPGKRYCAGCGARLDGESPPAPTPAAPVAGAGRDPRVAAPAGYTPRHLADRILRDRAALQGERKQVTVLFADVSGFTSLAERLDPEQVHELMSRAFDLMLEAVHRYEGTVNQFLGDGLMALFGAPVAHEDHARRAALAALAIRRALARYREEVRGRHGADFRMRLGLNTGLVVVGAIGDNLRMDYTAVGDTTNVAARMQQRAEPDQIVVAEATGRAIAGDFELGPLGTLVVKNRAAPVAAWELRRQRRAAAAPARSPFVGRQELLDAVLRAATAVARSGQGRAAYVVGEPGMGKSRLLLELRQRVEDSMDWLEGRCVSYGQSTAFLPFVEILRQAFEIEEPDTEPEAVAKVERGLAGLGERARELAPYLRFALSLDPGDPAVARMDSNARLGHLLQSATRLLQLRSQRRPTVLVVEDLHWVDESSEAYLRTLVDELPGLASLLILTWRPSFRPAFAEHTYASRVALEPLEEPDARRLVVASLGLADPLDDLTQVVARKAEGNPFFVEEIVRALVETGALRGEAGRLVLERPLSTLQVPDRVQDVIAARIDRLTETQKQTVQLAAVIGREFPLRLLRHVSETPDAVERGLGELKRLEFVYEKAGAEDAEFVFKHALTQDVAYESILQARRRELHGRIGRAMEELYPERLDDRVEALAHHFLHGEDWDRAAHYARLAGDRATAFCLDARAVEFYTQALDALDHLPEDAETARRGVDVRLALRAPLWRGGQLERLYDVYKEAEVLAQRYGQTDRLDAVFAFFAQYHWAKGQQQDAIAYGQLCLEAAERRQDLGLRVTGHYYLAWSHYVLGHFAVAIDHVDRILEGLAGPAATERFGLSGLPYSGACAHAALALLEQGDLDRALVYLERGEEVAERARHLYSTVPIGIARGLVLLELDRVPEAVAALEAMVALCRERRFVGQLMLSLAAASQAYSRAGRHEEAIGAALEAIRVKDEARVPVTRSHHVAALAQACLGAGRLEEAEAAAREAIDWAGRLGERPWAGWAHWVLGEVARRRGDERQAARAFAAARAVAEELGMRPLAARCEGARVSRG